MDDTIRSRTIVNNPHLLELYFPHLYDNDEEQNIFQGGNIHILEESAFENNVNLTAVTFSAVREIGNRAFFNCNSLKNIDWGHCNCKGNTDDQQTWQEHTIGDSAFTNCYELEELYLDKLTMLSYLGEYSFYDCHSLTALTLPKSSNIKKIENYTFWNCNSLSSVTFPSNIKEIGDHAFENGYNISEINISGITTLGKSSFDNCSGATKLVLSEDWEIIPYRCFANCSSLTTLNLRSNNSGATVGRYAFSDCESLSSVTFGTNVDNIDMGAFYACGNLVNVEAVNVKNIGIMAFSNNPTQSLNLSNVEGIGSEAFKYNTSLSSVTIGEEIRIIGASAFTNCTYLKQVTIRATTPPEIGVDVFTDTASDLQIRVPRGYLEAYQTAPGWSDYSSRMIDGNFTNDD